MTEKYKQSIIYGRRQWLLCQDSELENIKLRVSLSMSINVNKENKKSIDYF